MIYDCFTFFNENDVAAIRFEELDPVVDKFIVVHGNTTFRGQPKDVYYDYDRHARYADKVEHIIVNTAALRSTRGESAWDREALQRNGIAKGLRSAAPDDIIVLSDCDEIPRREIIRDLDPQGLVALRLQVFVGGINLLSPNRHTIKVFKYQHMTTPQEIRKAPWDELIEDGGWEFSSLNTPEGISEKLKSFSHHELDTPEVTDVESIRARLERHEDIIGWGIKSQVVPVDETWPHAIRNNREYWSKYEWKE